MRRNEYSSSVYRQENVKELLLQQPLTSGQFTGQKHPFFAKVHPHSRDYMIIVSCHITIIFLWND